MPEIEVVKSLLQMGAAGILFLAGYGMLRFLREERVDRAQERTAWLERFDRIAARLETLAQEITAALVALRAAQGARCPLTGCDRAAVEELERRIREKNR